MPTLNPAVSGSGLPPQDGGILVFGDGSLRGRIKAARCEGSASALGLNQTVAVFTN